MKTAGRLALLLSILATVTVVSSHGGRNDDNDSNNDDDNKSQWEDFGNFDASRWKGLSWYLKKLPQKQFFGMRFVLNITGEACLPDWNWPKPPCWSPGWPWPWPGHGRSTTRKTTIKTTTARRTSPTTASRTSTTTTGQSSTSTSTTTTTTTTTSTQSAPTSPTSPETTTCPYTIDLADQNFCRDIRFAANGTGPMKDCKKYYTNETLWDFHEQCVQFQCKYQRAYRCYGMVPFVTNCSAYLTEDESIYGWRHDNACDMNSTPFPPITFTEIPSTTATRVLAKRSARRASNENGNNDDDGDNEPAIIDEGTQSVAFGIKNNWCVPRIFSYWWRKHGGKFPWENRSSEDSDNNDWSRGDSWEKGGKGGKAGGKGRGRRNNRGRNGGRNHDREKSRS